VSTHTKGPWKFVEYDYPLTTGGRYQQRCVYPTHLPGDETFDLLENPSAADARLMAAAPELAEQLQLAVETIEQLAPKGLPRGVVDVVLAGHRAALEKAGVK
jgi:hypothetical protein